MKDSFHKTRLLDTVRKTVADHRMIESGSGVLVGLSGGPDSVALLHLLHDLAGETKFWIAAAHLDHGLRSDSHLDAACAANYADRLGIPIRLKNVDVRGLAESQGISIEEAGRTARYAFFEEVRTSLGAAVIATAHHADDQVETFFLRIFRGSSVQGLGGIPPVRGRIIRPLAYVTREEIIDYLNRHDLEYRVDATNLDCLTDRNFIRNRLIPVIAERFPGFRTTIGRTVELIRQDEQFLNDRAGELAAVSISREKDKLTVSVPVLRDAPQAVASRVLLSALYELSGPDVRWSRAHVKAALRLLRAPKPSARVTLPGRVVLLREYDTLKMIHTHPQELPRPIDLTVTGPGTVEIAQAGVTLTFRLIEPTGERKPPGDGNTEWFDADGPVFPLKIRSPLPGDRIRPWGMQGSRKVKKVLIDMKIPCAVRKTLPLVIRGDEILWIPGIRRGRAAAVTPSTQRILEMKRVEITHNAPQSAP